MKRLTLFAALFLLLNLPAIAADVRIDAVTPVPPNTLQVQLSCSQCPELVRILLPPIGTWVDDAAQERRDLLDWEPIEGSVSSVTTKLVRKTRNTPLLPALVDVHWGHEIPNSPLAPPGTPANLYVEGSTTCAVLRLNQKCEASGAGACVMSNADPAFDQWCWAPQGSCQLKFPRCP